MAQGERIGRVNVTWDDLAQFVKDAQNDGLIFPVLDEAVEHGATSFSIEIVAWDEDLTVTAR